MVAKPLYSIDALLLFNAIVLRFLQLCFLRMRGVSCDVAILGDVGCKGV